MVAGKWQAAEQQAVEKSSKWKAAEEQQTAKAQRKWKAAEEQQATKTSTKWKAVEEEQTIQTSSKWKVAEVKQTFKAPDEGQPQDSPESERHQVLDAKADEAEDFEAVDEPFGANLSDRLRLGSYSSKR